MIVKIWDLPVGSFYPFLLAFGVDRLSFPSNSRPPSGCPRRCTDGRGNRMRPASGLISEDEDVDAHAAGDFGSHTSKPELALS